MKIHEYKAILSAVERALEVCEQSSDFMDQVHREICEQLKATHTQLRQLIESQRPSPP